MATRKLYQENVYQKEASARILEALESPKGCLVRLDQTVFFPTGGGQSCDRGTLDGYAVTDVSEKGDEVWHLVDGPAEALRQKAVEGAQVALSLDWAHRFDNMQRHCGEHIVSGIFYREYGGVNRGFHMGDAYMTIDISLEEDPAYREVTWEMAKHVELCANQVIWSDAPVTTRRFATREEAAHLPLRKALTIERDISIVCVGDPDDPADCVACCGTHPSTAGQVGLIKIHRVESNKGMFRVYLEAGARAFRAYQAEYDSLLALGRQLSAGPEDILKKYQAQQERQNETRAQLTRLRRHVLEKEEAALIDLLSGLSAPAGGIGVQAAGPAAASVYATAGGCLVAVYDVLTVEDLLTMTKDLIPHIPKLLFLVHRPSHTVLLCSRGVPHCGRLVRENASVYGGKGGGSDVSARAIFEKEEYVDTFIDLLDKHLR